MCLQFSWQILPLRHRFCCKRPKTPTRPSLHPQLSEDFILWQISIKKDKTNLRHVSVLQGCVSPSALVQIAVFPPYLASLQSLDLLCVWITNSLENRAQVHHCIKCLISVLGRALFFYQDFHFDFLLQYSLSYCWEDRPVSKEKPRSIRCFFSFLYFFLLLVVGISTTLPKKSWLRGLSSEYFSFETSLILAFLVCSNAEPFKIGLVS